MGSLEPLDYSHKVCSGDLRNLLSFGYYLGRYISKKCSTILLALTRFYMIKSSHQSGEMPVWGMHFRVSVELMGSVTLQKWHFPNLRNHSILLSGPASGRATLECTGRNTDVNRCGNKFLPMAHPSNTFFFLLGTVQIQSHIQTQFIT